MDKMADELPPEEVGCFICLEILIEPITMPCNHRLCKPCFQQNFEVTSMNCPFCKKRIGTWYRKAKDINNLIDTELWDRLKAQFPAKIEARVNGVTKDDVDEIFYDKNMSHSICEEGQIKQEYEYEKEKFEIENHRISEKERLKSEALILKIQREELSRDTPFKSQNEMAATLKSDLELNSPDFHGWPSLEDKYTENAEEKELSLEFIDHQRKIEEQICLTKDDEQFAKHIQNHSESPRASTSFAPPFTIKSTEKPKMLKKLFEESSDDSSSDEEPDELPDIEDTQDMCQELLKCDKVIPLDIYTDFNSKSINLNDLIDQDFVNLQKEQEEKIRQEKEDEKMARELQRQMEEEDKRINNSDIVTRTQSPYNSKSLKRTPVPVKRQMSIEESIKYGYGNDPKKRHILK